jgi:hypothetical protein
MPPFTKSLTLSQRRAYPAFAATHCQSGLVTSKHTSARRRNDAVFLCVPFGYSASMVRLDGDTFACAGFLCDLLTNPVQSNHPHLVMNGSTSLITQEVICHV